LKRESGRKRGVPASLKLSGETHVQKKKHRGGGEVFSRVKTAREMGEMQEKLALGCDGGKKKAVQRGHQGKRLPATERNRRINKNHKKVERPATKEGPKKGQGVV